MQEKHNLGIQNRSSGNLRRQFPSVALAARRRATGVQPATVRYRNAETLVPVQHETNAAALRLRGHLRGPGLAHARRGFENGRYARLCPLSEANGALTRHRASRLDCETDCRFPEVDRCS